MNWYLTVVKDNYFNFKGRARRKEYWMFVLINIIITSILMFLDNLLGLNIVSERETFMGKIEVEQPYGYLYSIYGLLVLIPGIAVSFRRLHDIGRSGWYFLWLFLPLIGFILVTIAMCRDSQPEENQFGISPKYGDEDFEEEVE